MSGEFMTYETYLRQQVDKGCYGVAIISAEVALDIANFIEKQRERIAEADRKTENSSEKPNNCEECEHWNDTEDGCADRHGCKDEPQTERSE